MNQRCAGPLSVSPGAGHRQTSLTIDAEVFSRLTWQAWVAVGLSAQSWQLSFSVDLPPLLATGIWRERGSHRQV